MPKSDADRLAAALRANLKRRKAQARARQGDDAASDDAVAMQPGSTTRESAGAETNGRDQD